MQIQTTKEEAQQIASTAREQVFVMSPELQAFVKHTAFDADGTLQLRFNNESGANHVSVQYDYGHDLYNLSIHECRILDVSLYIINDQLEQIDGVYCEQLGEIVKGKIGV